ncbi:NUDIX hydrolase [Myceligenerans pegani]|uniref:NUDIX domain-containing protein n=1 Tax=Myceligenerans pegani TaxID=2776917 RepID=A0ABR9MTR6_9MICO|nr:NUDIX domain-containing protein [Myceligenerans sp. TRM 65318]MBE1874775.1 NUDIX domain-containing protein [Myceligenerans sp. TRM 65318]MBE3017046.1 NUDIX domain-containing protein [Myceligenerans sp. TRM 65318]
MDLRIGCYAVITDDAGRMLLPHWNEGNRSGWTMPGGGMEPGEHPADAVVREVFEETGYHVELGELLGVDNIVIPAEDRIAPGAGPIQGVRLVWRARITGGELTVERDGTTDDVAWHAQETVDVLDRVELVDVARRWAGLI